MNINLYVNNSANNVLNKDITSVASLSTSHFKGDVDNFHIELSLPYNSNYDKVNYIQVPHLNRYYFVDSIDYSQQHIIYKCHVDVLMTYKSKIRESSQIVIAQENNGDMYLENAEWQEDSRQYVRNLYFNEDHFNHSQDCYILGVMS